MKGQCLNSSWALRTAEAGLLVAMGHFLLLLLAWLPDKTMEQVTLWLNAKGGAGFWNLQDS